MVKFIKTLKIFSLIIICIWFFTFITVLFLIPLSKEYSKEIVVLERLISLNNINNENFHFKINHDAKYNIDLARSFSEDAYFNLELNNNIEALALTNIDVSWVVLLDNQIIGQGTVNTKNNYYFWDERKKGTSRFLGSFSAKPGNYILQFSVNKKDLTASTGKNRIIIEKDVMNEHPFVLFVIPVMFYIMSFVVVVLIVLWFIGYLWKRLGR